MLTLKETEQLCIKAHMGQYRRAMTVEDIKRRYNTLDYIDIKD